MLSVVLVPVIKDKAGKISSYCLIASVISKLVEVIMLDRIEMYMIQILISLVSRGNMEQTSVFMF